jgi:hypothetical protein
MAVPVVARVTAARFCYVISCAMTSYGEDHKNSRLIRSEILRKSKSFVIVVTA